MTANPRYDGKPLLRLLELYVLRAIGELSQAEEDKLVGMAPKLQSLYGGGGPWYEAVAASMKMPPNMPVLIQDMWAKNREIARANQVSLPKSLFLGHSHVSVVQTAEHSALDDAAVALRRARGWRILAQSHVCGGGCSIRHRPQARGRGGPR
jgi:hypothetical protein